MKKDTGNANYTGLEIAVIGMACRFPQAKNVQEFWRLLCNGEETVRRISDGELSKSGVDKKLLNNSLYVKYGNCLAEKEYFDSKFFNYLPDEARLMDPQMRFFHECVWESLEDAGYNPEEYEGLIGLYAGAGANFNWQTLSLIENETNQVDEFSAQHLNNRDFMPTKVAYKLNLKGPAVLVQTACSTSLVAIHLACRSILMGECNLAVAGGVTILSTPDMGYLYTPGMILSPDGHCRTFDAAAQGTIFGEGVGTVVLKRLKNALADGDNIHAIIKGSAINNDGFRKVGYTAPSIDGQVEVIKMAQKVARVEPETIGYIEAHGTGTTLGDPIEIEALRLAFGDKKKQYCGIGSVKTNIGHLDTAAGVASFIKVVLSLKNRMLPPTVNFEEPNPKIDFCDSPFFVITRLETWERQDSPLRAGVNSLGIGGTNSHIILEEAPQIALMEDSHSDLLLLLSAKSKEALQSSIANLKEYLLGNEKVKIGDVAYTLHKGRKHFPYRKYVVCKNHEEAIKKLENQENREIYDSVKPFNQSVIFVILGQGLEYAKMGTGLYGQNRMFQTELDKVYERLSQVTDIDSNLLNTATTGIEKIDHLRNDPRYTKLSVVVFEYALSQLLLRMGLKPDVIIGFGLGEFVAASISGLLTFEEVLQILISREKSSKSNFEDILAKIDFRSPRIPYYSSTTGKLIERNNLSVDYWLQIANQSAGDITEMKALFEQRKAMFIEVGSGKRISSIIQQSDSVEFDIREKYSIINLLRPENEDIGEYDYFLNQVGQIWLTGLSLDWRGLYSQGEQKIVSLPTYPFEKIKYPAVGNPLAIISERMKVRPEGRNPDINQWFYIMSWEQKPLVLKKKNSPKRSYLIFGEESAFTDSLISKLNLDAELIINLLVGDRYQKLSEVCYTINPAESADYSKLLNSLQSTDCVPDTILHLSNMKKTAGMAAARLQDRMAESFYSLVRLVQTMAKKQVLGGKEVIVVTNDLHSVLGDEQLVPEKGAILGFLKVLPQEFPSVKTYCIDISLSDSGDSMINNIYDEIQQNSSAKLVAYRQNRRWVQKYTSLNLQGDFAQIREIKEGAVYLIVGGLGNLGFVLAKHLLIKYRARVVLFGRTDFSAVTDELAVKADYLEKKRRMDELKEISNADVLYHVGDSGRLEDIENCVKMIEDRYGELNGVIYSAGILAGDSFLSIDSITEKGFEEQFAAKVYGLLNLHKVLGQRELDFCLVISSLASVLGGLGYGAYASANSFIDYYLYFLNQNSWIAVNLDGLQFDENQYNSHAYLIDPGELVEIFDKIVHYIETPQVIVSTGDIQARLRKWVQQDSLESPSEKQPMISLDRSQLSTEYAAPVTDMERDLIKIWQEFFGVKEVGIEDSFFELGGDSLKALTLSKRIFQEFNIQISLGDFFNKNTVRELADYLDNWQPEPAEKNSEKIVSYFAESDEAIINQLKQEDSNIEAIYPLSAMQLAALNYNLMFSRSKHNIQVVRCVLEDVDIGRFKDAWEKVIQRHSILRTEFKWRKFKTPIQLIYRNAAVPFAVLDWGSVPTEHRPEMIKNHIEDIRHNNLKKAPLMHVSLIRENERQFQLVWCYQNLLFDGWSAEIILNDVITYYTTQSIVESEASPGFTDYIEWLYQRDREQVQQFWRQEFENFDSGSLALSSIEAVDAIQEPAQNYLTLTEDEKIKIKDFAKKNNLSLNTIIVGCWSILLSKVLKENDLIIGVLTSGRPLTLEGVELIAGMFTNILPVRIILPDSPITLDWFRKLQQKLYKCKEYEFVSLAEISKWCNLVYSKLQRAIYERTVVYVDFPTDETLNVAGVSDYASHGGLVVPLRLITGPELTLCIKYDQRKFVESGIESMLSEIKNILLSLSDEFFDKNNL